MRDSNDMQKLARIAFFASIALVIIVGALWGFRLLTMQHYQTTVQADNQVILGFPMPGHSAPDFKLVNQFDQTVTLSSLHGHEVVLAFIDSRCTTLCPLTAAIMYNAKNRLSPSAAKQVMLVAVNANPTASSIADVRSWSITHGMLHQWLFLTGTAKQLQSVYHLYNMYDQVGSNGAVTHDALTIIIDSTGHERLFFETLDSQQKNDLSNEEIGMEIGMRQWLPQP